jgi:hypothetical protein
MPSSLIWWRVALVRTDVSKEPVSSIIRLKTISKLRTTLAVPSNWTSNVTFTALVCFTLMMRVLQSCETPVLERATWHHIPDDGIIVLHCVITIAPYCLAAQWGSWKRRLGVHWGEHSTESCNVGFLLETLQSERYKMDSTCKAVLALVLLMSVQYLWRKHIS